VYRKANISNNIDFHFIPIKVFLMRLKKLLNSLGCGEPEALYTLVWEGAYGAANIAAVTFSKGFVL
jgi:hypothetical protein